MHSSDYIASLLNLSLRCSNHPGGGGGESVDSSSLAPNPNCATTAAAITKKYSSKSASTPLPQHIVKVVVPPSISAKSNVPFSKLTVEERARVAVVNAYRHSFARFANSYAVFAVIGFGANGVVLGAKDLVKKTNVAVKIIYKQFAATDGAGVPFEIAMLKDINAQSDCQFLLRCLDSWDDARNFYLVTNLFGSNWIKGFKDFKLPRLEFFTISRHPPVTPLQQQQKQQQQQPHPAPNATKRLRPALGERTVWPATPTPQTHSIPFSLGASDLWAWSIAHRAHMLANTPDNSAFLPLTPVKHILRQAATALRALHSAGFFHGDVKLENILVEYPGEHADSSDPSSVDALINFPNAVLSDYGHTRRAVVAGDGQESSSQDAAARIVRAYGTQDVAPPELLDDSPFRTANSKGDCSSDCTTAIDGRRCDVFALGMVAFVLLSARGDLPEIVSAAPHSGADEHSAPGHSTGRRRRAYADLAAASRNGRFPFTERELAQMGECAAALIGDMCALDPSARPTIEQVLNHRWFLETADEKAYV
ncbi:hypothetical protein HDU84_008477 [Entophlyctis sp. JEL0112]|nr:hypothetical protein HDU84_008477 [Entophlyctis sp. JEL0112]